MTHIFRALAATLLIAFGMMGCSNSSNGRADPTLPPASTPQQWVTGYYVAYERDLYQPEEIDWNGLTHIVMARVMANSDGSLNTNFDWDPVNGPALARDVAARAHENQKKAILMLGGSDNGTQIHDAVANHRAEFIDNLVSAMNDYGYDGLDLDWESDIDWDLFKVFVTDLRKAAPNAILTLPGGPLNINFDTVDPRLVEVVAQIDQFNLMSYHPATSWAGSGWYSWHNSPLSGVKPTTPVTIEESFNRYVAAGVPKSKLGMGIAFYAICYTGGITAPDQATEGGVTIAGGDHDFPLSDLFGTNGVYAESARHWDASARVPYLSLAEAERHNCRYVSFDDEQSILEKGQFTRDHGYGGIIVWTLNQGYVRSHSKPNFLMEALRKGFIEPDFQPGVGVSIMQGNAWLKTTNSLQLSALVTGTTEKSVVWSISTPECGSITANGLYTAPTSEKSCTIVATPVADPATSRSATVTISNSEWTPALNITRSGTWWVEVAATDVDVTALSVAWPDGSILPLSLLWTEGTGFRHFAANYEFPDAGGDYTFHARSADNRSAAVVLTVPACVHGADNFCQLP